MPEAGLENCRVTVIQTIEPNGEMAYTVSRSGDVPLSTYIGLIELAKLTLIRAHDVQHPPVEEDDD